MQEKNRLRKKYFNLRKKKYYEISKDFFLPLINLIKLNYKKKKIEYCIIFSCKF